MEAAKIVATLTRVVGDVGLAEDLAQEALVDALTQAGHRSAAQCRSVATTVAKRKAIDQWRRQDHLDAKYATLARDLETESTEPTWIPTGSTTTCSTSIFISSHPVCPRSGDRADPARSVA